MHNKKGASPLPLRLTEVRPSTRMYRNRTWEHTPNGVYPQHPFPDIHLIGRFQLRANSGKYHFKTKIAKRRDKTNFNKAIGALSNPIIGTSAMLADIEIVWFTGLLTYTLINLMSILIPEVSLVGVDKKTFFIITAIPCIIINYLFLWRKKKYLEYFEAFQKGSKKLNTIWCFVSIICFVLAWVLFIFSLCIM